MTISDGSFTHKAPVDGLSSETGETEDLRSGNRVRRRICIYSRMVLFWVSTVNVVAASTITSPSSPDQVAGMNHLEPNHLFICPLLLVSVEVGDDELKFDEILMRYFILDFCSLACSSKYMQILLACF